MSENNIRMLIQSGRLADFIVGRGEYKSHRPEEDAARWNQVIDFYNSAATLAEKRYIEELLMRMFDSGSKLEQIPALIISENIRLPELKTRLVDVIQSGQYYKFDAPVQDSILITIVALQVEGVRQFLLDTLLEKRKIRNFITWSDKSSWDDIATEHDLWRMKLLAQYYEESDESTKAEIERQLFSLSKKHKKARTILNEFLFRISNYQSFKGVIERYLQAP